MLRGLFFDLKAQVLSHLVHWMSSSPLCGWFVVCWVLFLFVCLFVSNLKASSLLQFHLFSHNLRIVDRLQTF